MKTIKMTYQCSENWNKFTPTQQGAFCNKCQIDVKDFTGMSNIEIKEFLEQNKNNHLCGRFNLFQIESFNNDFSLWQTNSLPSFQSKFIFALIIVFGITLFSCSNPSQQNQIESLAKIVNEDWLNQQLTKEKPQVDSSLVDNSLHSNPKQQKIKKHVAPIIDKDGASCGGTMGEVKNNQYKSETDSIINLDLFNVYPTQTIGLVVYQNTNDDEDAEVEKDTVKPKTETITNNEFLTNVFPNPTTGVSTLEIDVKKEEYYHINLTNLNGEILRTLYNDVYQAGHYVLNFDLFDEPSGLYLISINTPTQQKTLKIVKQN